jgi:DNA-binding NarL/FixJ family response regulator
MTDASWFSRSIMDKLASLKNPYRCEPKKEVLELTPREREVLALISEGLDDKAISQRLALSGNTVRNHVASIYGKIGVNRRPAAVAWARDRGVS